MHELHEDDFPPVGIDADARRALRVEFVMAGGARRLEPLAEFQGQALHDQAVVSVVETQPRQGGRDAAEKSGVFDEERLGAIAGSGQRRRLTASAGADDENLGADRLSGRRGHGRR